MGGAASPGATTFTFVNLVERGLDAVGRPGREGEITGALGGATDAPSATRSHHGYMDDIDWAIVELLQDDGRVSIRELSRRISLSAPATAERVRRLELSGVILGYTAVIDPRAIGIGIRAIIRMGCENTIRCVRRELDPAKFPEIMEMHRVSGDDCSVLIAYARDVEHLENLIDRLARWSRASTTLILSTPLPRTALRRQVLTPAPGT